MAVAGTLQGPLLAHGGCAATDLRAHLDVRFVNPSPVFYLDKTRR
jgi:hypothetical protein